MARNQDNSQFIVFANLVESGPGGEGSRGEQVRTTKWAPPESFTNGNASGGIAPVTFDQVGTRARARARKFKG